MKIKHLCYFITFLLFMQLYPEYKNTVDAIETLLQSLPNLNGVILIARDEKIIFKKCYGYAHHEFKILNSFDTKFPIASNAKSFTAAAIMQLNEKGLLSVNDKVSMYIPGINDGITIHHLLTHTSGIQNYYKQWDSIVRCSNLSDMITVIKEWSPEFKPGLRYAYCNTGYLLLAAIVEKVSGNSR